MQNKNQIIVISIVTAIILLIVLTFINSNKIVRTVPLTNQLESKEILINIKKIDENKENGYLIYQNGNKYKYDLNSSKISLLKEKVSSNNLKRIKKLISQIDESKKDTINTLVPLTKGTIIYAYDNNMKILIKDLYNDNYSDASEEIKLILKEEGLL